MTTNQKFLQMSLYKCGVPAKYEHMRRGYHLFELFRIASDRRFTANKRQEARDMLVLTNIRLVITLAEIYIPDNYYLKDDLIQEGIIFLTNWIDQLISSRNSKIFFRKEKKFFLKWVSSMIIREWKIFILLDRSKGTCHVPHSHSPKEISGYPEIRFLVESGIRDIVSDYVDETLTDHELRKLRGQM